MEHLPQFVFIIWIQRIYHPLGDLSQCNHDSKGAKFARFGNSLSFFNPLGHSVQLRGRQNHVVLQTLYLKNRKESDMKIEGFFEEEEISYIVAKFGHPRTFLADLALI